MAYNVKFLRGNAENFAALSKDNNTFYVVDIMNEGALVATEFYIGASKLSSYAEITAAVARINTAETDIDNLEKAVGTVANLTTDEKTNLVAAINELVTKVNDATSAGKVTLKEDTTSTEFAKVYKLYQGEVSTEDATKNLIGTINIPKDMVVESGTLVNEDGEGNTGKFIKLVLANANSDVIYIDVKDLIDIYKAAEGATEVQLTVTGNTISANLVDSGVTTAKIADKNVTLAKLSETLQTSIGKADTAVQAVVAGENNGTIKVDNTEVAVTGLKSAAYAEASSFEVAGAAKTAEDNAKAYVDTALTWGTF